MSDVRSPDSHAAQGVAEEEVKSPCVNVCRMNETTGYCEGCFRTIDEIAGWSQLSDDEKRRVLAALPERRGLR